MGSARQTNIAIVTRFPPHLGGAEIVVQNLAHALAVEAEVTIITPDEGSFSPDLRVIAFRNNEELRRAITRCRPSIINVHAPYYANTVARVADTIQVPTLITLHGLYYQYFGPVYRHHAQTISKLSSYFSTVSLIQKRSYLTRWGIANSRMFVTPNGVFLPRQRIGPYRTNHHEKARWHVPMNSKIILMPARISPLKGIDVMLRALPLLASDTVLLLSTPLGRLDPVGTSYLRKLRALAKKLGVEKRFIVQFHDQESVLALHRVADLIVLSSLTEASPISILEGMAGGVPVVAARVGGIPEIIEHKRSGWLFTPNNPKALALAVRQALAISPASLQILLQNARQTIQDRYSIDRMKQTYQNVYENCIQTYAHKT